MSHMFYGCRSFDCDLSNWDTSSVVDVELMFTGANNFSCNISEWHVSCVTQMDMSFAYCLVDYEEIWCAHQGDAVWEEQCRQNRELRSQPIRAKRKKDNNWERRRAWMIVISPFLKYKEVALAPVQVVFDIQGLARLITSYL